MSKVRLYGDTSGYVDLKAPDVASNVTITLPNATGPFATETYVDGAIAAIPGIGSNVVEVIKDDGFTTTSSSFVVPTGLTLTFTPTSATSKVLLLATLNCAAPAGGRIAMSVFADAANLVVPASPGNRVRAYAAAGTTGITDDNVITFSQSFSILHSPATTSAITYDIRVSSPGTQTVYVNRGETDADNTANMRAVSTLIAIEVAA